MSNIEKLRSFGKSMEIIKLSLALKQKGKICAIKIL